MYETYGDSYQYVWCLNDKEKFPKKYKNIDFAKFLSFKYIWQVMTSKYIINNHLIEPFFPLRKSQIFVNTWHGGGAYKKMSISSPVFKYRYAYMCTTKKLRVKMMTYTISACEKFTFFLAPEWNLPPESFLPIGMPRNDIFFIDYSVTKKKVFEFYSINRQNKLVLYAPTFHGDYYKLEKPHGLFDVQKLICALTLKFHGNFILLYRAHYVYNKIICQDVAINVSNYPDMQELLCAADVLITDYSSSIWDYSFTYKPCFLYAPDIEKYKYDRDFYTPIEEWPFPLAKTTQELVENIRNFNKKEYIDKIHKHHKELGSYETGHATEQFCKLVF
jgi:CDP-glycerol glycerophosphotransferase